jgi:hypothetical protein
MGTPNAFATTDFSLAVTLSTLGVGFINHHGEPASKGDQVEWKEIKASELDRLGLKFEEAEAKGLGEIAYGFAEHPMRSEIIKALRNTREQGKNKDIPDTFAIKCECGKDHTADLVPILAAFAGYLFANRKYLADRREKAKARLRNDKSANSFDIISPKSL